MGGLAPISPRLIFEALLRILSTCNYILINALDHPCQFDDIPWVFGIANPFEEREVVATLVSVLYHPLIRHHAFLPSAEPVIFLTEIAKYAKKHHLTIHITGDADEATGTAKFNRTLSIARARNIAKQFINNGIDKSQMKAVSLGGIRQFARKEANRFTMVVMRE